jgi:hypothetical protein
VEIEDIKNMEKYKWNIKEIIRKLPVTAIGLSLLTGCDGGSKSGDYVKSDGFSMRQVSQGFAVLGEDLEGRDKGLAAASEKCGEVKNITVFSSPTGGFTGTYRFYVLCEIVQQIKNKERNQVSSQEKKFSRKRVRCFAEHTCAWVLTNIET